MQMQPLPQPSRCVHTPVAPGTRAGTRGDTSILHPPSYPLTSYILTSHLPSYSELNPNTAKNHPLRLSEQSHSRLLYGARRPSHIGRWPKEGSIHPSTLLSTVPRTGKHPVQAVKKRKLGNEDSTTSGLLPCKAIQVPWWEAGEALLDIVRLRCRLD